MINYSVIIPHKNTPELLQKCLDSIPIRSDVQVIVVDDNSDRTQVDFENFPQWEGENYESYFTKEGRGAGYARNIGLEHAVGKWIVFADADDFFMVDITTAMDEYVDTAWEIVFFKACSLKYPSMKIDSRADSCNEAVEIAIKQEDYRYLFTHSSPCCKFFKHDFLLKYSIVFHEVRWSNDVFFCAMCALYAEKYIAVNMNVYCIVNIEGSLTKNQSVECYRVRCVEAIEEMKLLFNKFHDFDVMFYWFYHSWYLLWSASVYHALLLFPQCLLVGRYGFWKQFRIHWVYDVYNSSRLKQMIHKIRRVYQRIISRL